MCIRDRPRADVTADDDIRPRQPVDVHVAQHQQVHVPVDVHRDVQRALPRLHDLQIIKARQVWRGKQTRARPVQCGGEPDGHRPGQPAAQMRCAVFPHVGRQRVYTAARRIEQAHAGRHLKPAQGQIRRYHSRADMGAANIQPQYTVVRFYHVTNPVYCGGGRRFSPCVPEPAVAVCA